MHYDQYKDNIGMKALISDKLDNWKSLNEEYSFALKSKHDSFIKLSADEAMQLKKLLIKRKRMQYIS